MATLMIVGNSEGEKRCDAKCYDAKHPVCNCCCGGMNHGKGLGGALQATENLCLENLKAMGREDLIEELNREKEKALNLKLF